MIFKQETVKSWFSGMKSSVNTEIIQPFQNAEQVIWKYNQAIKHNSLTQKGWERLLAQSDDSMRAYLTNIKGTTASMTGYTTSLQGNITGFKKVSSAINQYNVLASAGIQKQNEFSSAVAMTNGQLGNYLRGLNGSKASLGGYVSSLIGATAKTVALQAATMALNAVVSMGLMTAIQLAIQGFDKLMNSAKRASEAADEAFSESNDKVQQNKAELKSLDELIAKYKELKESGELDVEGRKEVKELQNSIADLVGVQASNLDLVNGKLDDEIKKLDEISAKQARNAYETAIANYNNSKKAVENATGDSSIGFVDGYAYVGDREKEAEKILQDAGFVDYYYRGGRKQTGGRGVSNNGFSTIVFDTYDREGNELKGAQEKADYLQSMIDVLEQNGQRATDLYAGLIKQRDDYLKYIDDQQNAANSLVDSWITYSQFSNKELSKINVDSVESFETYRQKMIDEIQKDETVGQMMADGILSQDDLEIAINDYMATSVNFSTWYEQWAKGIQDTSLNLNEITVSFKDLINTDDLKETKQALIDLAKSGELTEDTLTSTREYRDLLTETGTSAKEALSIIEQLALAEIDFENYQTQLENARSSISDLQSILADMNENKGVLSDDSIDKIISDYPTLIDYLGQTEELETKINELINEQAINAQNASDKMLEYSTDVYDTILSSTEDVLNGITICVESETKGLTDYLGDAYNTDLRNFSNLAQAKEEIESNLIGSLSEGWAEFYGLQKNAITGTLGITKNWAEFFQDEEAQSKLSAYNEAMTRLNAVASKFTSLSTKTLSTVKNTSSSSSSKDSSSSSESEKSFDWIETNLSNNEKALDKLETKANNVYTTWESRNKALAQSIDKVKESISLQEQAYARYMKESESVGLSSYYKNLVQKGAMDISTITDETLKDKITSYQDWYEKAQDCLETQEELKASLNELNSQSFEHIKTEYEAMVESLETQKEHLESQITLLSKGSDYDSIRNAQTSVINTLNTELSKLQSKFNSLSITKNSEEWYELKNQITDVQQQIVDAKNTLKEIDSLEFENVQEVFDFDISNFEHNIDIIQGKIDLLETKGMFANESYYDNMISLTLNKLNSLNKERNSLQEMLNNTAYTKGTSEWNDMFTAILDIDTEIQSETKSLEEYNNAIRDLNWEIFEYFEESVSRVTEEVDFLKELLSDEDMFDDKGNVTKYTDATMGLHFTNIEIYKKQAQDYYEEMQSLQEQLVNGAGQDVLEQYREMEDLHRDAINAMRDEKSAILDLVEEGYQKQLDYLNEIIDKKKESLSAEKSLYDYQKSIQEKSDKVTSLQRQLDVYKNDNSEEGLAQAQKIKVELESAKADLEETEYEKMISDTEQMLDALSNDYEKWMNQRLDDESALLDEIKDEITTKSDEIMSTLAEVASEYGTTLSTSLSDIFNNKDPFESVVTAINNLVAEISGIVTNDSSNSNGSSGNKSSSGSNSTNSSNTGSSSTTTKQSSSTTTAKQTSTTITKSSSNASGIFIAQKSVYPKEKLDKDKSVVDRCKYFDFASDFQSRATYYKKLGGSGTYTGSSSQNTWLINKMKEVGYASGTNYAKGGLRWTQEDGEELIIRKSDGALLTPLGTGDTVFNADGTNVLYDFANDPQGFLEKFGVMNYTMPAVNVKVPDVSALKRNNTSPCVNLGGVHIAQVVTNDAQDFMKQLPFVIANDTKTQKVISEVVLGGALGHNSMNARRLV